LENQTPASSSEIALELSSLQPFGTPRTITPPQIHATFTSTLTPTKSLKASLTLTKTYMSPPTHTPTETIHTTPSLIPPSSETKVNLEIYNNTGQTIRIRLESKSNPGTGYDFILDQSGNTTFKIVKDTYIRTAWACDGVETTGTFIIRNNIRMIFTPCGNLPP
jgi:hypothetical protein